MPLASTTTPCIVSDGQATFQSQGVWARLSKHIMVIIAVVILGYIVLELAVAFRGEREPLTNAARALASLLFALAAGTYRSNMNRTMLRMVVQRARCARISSLMPRIVG